MVKKIIETAFVRPYKNNKRHIWREKKFNLIISIENTRVTISDVLFENHPY